MRSCVLNPRPSIEGAPSWRRSAAVLGMHVLEYASKLGLNVSGETP
jgi:hypothetical protein